jgi:CheY-like chemotaxis protein
MDGHEVLRQLKADPPTTEIPIILIAVVRGVLRDGVS